MSFPTVQSDRENSNVSYRFQSSCLLLAQLLFAEKVFGHLAVTDNLIGRPFKIIPKPLMKLNQRQKLSVAGNIALFRRRKLLGENAISRYLPSSSNWASCPLVEN